MIQIDLVLAEDLRIIDADPAQIEQVVLNLGVNAQHAMPDGGRLVIETRNVSMSDEFLRIHLEAKLGKYVLLAVSDSGVGMEPVVMDRIFEPFFTTKANGQGTGLGLSMVHGIVKQHGGYISATVNLGVEPLSRSTFPVSASEWCPTSHYPRNAGLGLRPFCWWMTMIVFEKWLGEMIEMAGYKVVTARTEKKHWKHMRLREMRLTLLSST